MVLVLSLVPHGQLGVALLGVVPVWARDERELLEEEAQVEWEGAGYGPPYAPLQRYQRPSLPMYVQAWLRTVLADCLPVDGTAPLG